MKTIFRLLPLALASWLLPQVAPAAPDAGSLTWVGRADASGSYLYDLSADGTRAVGLSYFSNRPLQPLFWRADTGVQNVDFPTEMGQLVVPSNADRPSIRGEGQEFCGSFGTSSYNHGFIWSEGTGYQDLGSPIGYNLSVPQGFAANGLRVCGYVSPGSGMVAAIWDKPDPAVMAGGGWNVIGSGFGAASSDARDISANGGRVVGSIRSQSASGNLHDYAYLWSQQSGLTLLTDDTSSYAEAHGISADGTTVCGRADRAGSALFRWTEATGIEYLTGSEGIGGISRLSADGSVIVIDTSSSAIIWDRAHGFCKLKDVLAAGGLDFNFDNISLSGAAGVSANGKTVAGSGDDGTGLKGFVATLPEAWTEGKPLASLRQHPDGNRYVHFIGVLQQSDDLTNWADVTPAPVTPYFVSTTGNRKFYRARLASSVGGKSGGEQTAPAAEVLTRR